METRAWKKEKDLLSEAYLSVYIEGTDGETDDLTEFEKKRLKANAGEEGSDEDTDDNAPKTEETAISLSDIGGEELGEPVEPIEGIEPDGPMEPDEVDTAIEDLKNLILNPPADKVEEYARSGRLHDYIDMLQQKLKAAEAVKAVYRGDDAAVDQLS